MNAPKKDQVLNVAAQMRAKGYVPLPEGAARCWLSPTTVRKWHDAGKVDIVVHGRRAFVNWVQLIRAVGVDKAVLLGIIQAADAPKFRAPNEKKAS